MVIIKIIVNHWSISLHMPPLRGLGFLAIRCYKHTEETPKQINPTGLKRFLKSSGCRRGLKPRLQWGIGKTLLMGVWTIRHRKGRGHLRYLSERFRRRLPRLFSIRSPHYFWIPHRDRLRRLLLSCETRRIHCLLG